jgi:ribose transport system permease protein
VTAVLLRFLRRYGTLIGFALILVFFWARLPDTFMTTRNWLNITQQLSMLMVVAAGMTIVMVMGDFDLSVGSMASLSGVVAAVLFVAGYPVWAAVGIALGPVTVPNLTIVAVLVVALVWVLLEQTTFGRRLYAIGGNIEAAYLSGVPVRRLKLAAFALTGLSAAGAGLLYASRVASANPTQGSGLMLNAIAAVFLGMTMSEQGEPRILATVVGVLILGVLDNGLTQMSVDSYIRQVLVGALILIAVGAGSIGQKRP